MVHNADEFWPLVAFSANSLLYLYNVEKASFHGVLRGHGGVRHFVLGELYSHSGT